MKLTGKQIGIKITRKSKTHKTSKQDKQDNQENTIR
jgi:hypothetical protein